MKSYKGMKRALGIFLAGAMIMQCMLPVYAEEPNNAGAGAGIEAVTEGTGNVISDQTVTGAPTTDTGSTVTVTETPGSDALGSSDQNSTQTPEQGMDQNTDQSNDQSSVDGQGINGSDAIQNEESNDSGSEPENDQKTKARAQLKATAEEPTPGLEYTTHVQTYGWMDPVTDGQQAGTTGLKKRMEAIRIHLTGLDGGRAAKATAEEQAQGDAAAVAEEEAQAADAAEAAENAGTAGQDEAAAAAEIAALTGSIEYQAHSQTFGWMDWVKDGELAGTEGLAKRLEAVRIRLTGEIAEKYDVYYKVHSSKFGDLGWAKNGQAAGSEGYARSIEAITIRLVKKGSADAPAQDTASFKSTTNLGNVTYSSHVQSYGWMNPVADGQRSGTTGKSKRMEAFKVNVAEMLDDAGYPIEGSVTYRAHSQSYGWMDWVQEGAIAGTVGKAKRLEALQIKLTGALAEQYDIYYRTHCASWGDLGWAKNGETAGTTGAAKSIESFEIRLVKKGDAAPGQDSPAAITEDNIGTVTYESSIAGTGWSGAVQSPNQSGTTGQKKKIEAFRISRTGNADVMFDGGISYRAYMQDGGWQGWKTDGETAGSTTDGKRVEAFQVKLTGEMANYCKVYYRAHVEKYGWLGWAQDGQTAGTNNCGYRIEAIQVMVVLKTAKAPGSTTGYFQDQVYKPRYNNAINTILSEAGNDLYSCYSWVVNHISYQTLPIHMNPPAGYSREEGYAIYAVENRRGNCFCYAAAFAGAAKRLGYTARYIEGGVGLRNGGIGPHGWVEIDLNGTTYICDPDGEYELGANFYMVTYGSARFNYVK